MMIIIPPEFLWVKSIGRQSKHEWCTFWTINTADKIWRPRAKAWRGFWNCLVWLDQWWKSSFPVSKHPETGGGIPHFHTPSFYINIDQLLTISKQNTSHSHWQDLMISSRRSRRSKKHGCAQKNNSLGAAVALACHCGRSWWEPNGDTEKGTGPSNAWIMSTGWLPTIRGFLAQWRPILELQQQQTAKK